MVGSTRKALRVHAYGVLFVQHGNGIHVLVTRNRYTELLGLPGGGMQPEEAKVRDYMNMDPERQHNCQFEALVRELKEEVRLDRPFLTSVRWLAKSALTGWKTASSSSVEEHRIVRCTHQAFYFFGDMGKALTLSGTTMQRFTDRFEATAEVSEVMFVPILELYKTALDTKSPGMGECIASPGMGECLASPGMSECLADVILGTYETRSPSPKQRNPTVSQVFKRLLVIQLWVLRGGTFPDSTDGLFGEGRSRSLRVPEIGGDAPTRRHQQSAADSSASWRKPLPSS